MKTVAHKIVVVTGGTKGIGFAVAERYRLWDNTVIVLARGAEDNGKDSFKCDVSKAEEVEAVFDKIFALYGCVDILVNNVGMGQSGAVEFIDNSLIKEIVDVNLMSVIYCTKAVLKRATSPLKIINMSSAAAFGVCPFRTMYSVTKNAVNVFTVGMRQELYNSDVQVCSISMGDTATDFGKHHPDITVSSPRYGDRIDRSNGFSAERSVNVDKPPKDKRMAPQRAALGICKISAKEKFKKYTYCIGFKYNFFLKLSRILNIQNISDVLRLVFEGRNNGK